jgi:hypothetical protein
MRRFDAFTWIVILAVLGLIVAAVITVNRSSDATPTPAAYRSDDNPAAPVYNLYLALQRGDAATARAQFTQAALDEFAKRGYDPIQNNIPYYANDATNRRIRIVAASEETPGIALVTVVEDNYGGGGLFESSTWSNRRVVRVAKEEGVWKIDDASAIY